MMIIVGRILFVCTFTVSAFICIHWSNILQKHHVPHITPFMYMCAYTEIISSTGPIYNTFNAYRTGMTVSPRETYILYRLNFIDANPVLLTPGLFVRTTIISSWHQNDDFVSTRTLSKHETDPLVTGRFSS